MYQEESYCFRESLEKLKTLQKLVKYLRCDNADGHITELKKIVKVNMVYTAPQSPQCHGAIE